MSAPVESLALAFGLVLSRVGAFVMTCPAFAPAGVVGIIRSLLIVGLSGALFVSLPHAVLPQAPLSAYAAELACGGLLGMVVRLGSVAATFGGELLDQGAGFGFIHMQDPMSQELSTPIQQLGQLLAGTLFFVGGGQRLVVQALAHSFDVAPAGHAMWHSANVLILSQQVGALFVTGLRLAAPLLAVLMASQLLLALLMRVAPQLNLWSVGFAITTSALLVGLFLFVPAWVNIAMVWWEDATAIIGQLHMTKVG